jgi:hypothetical protein
VNKKDRAHVVLAYEARDLGDGLANFAPLVGGGGLQARRNVSMECLAIDLNRPAMSRATSARAP